MEALRGQARRPSSCFEKCNLFSHLISFSVNPLLSGYASVLLSFMWVWLILQIVDWDMIIIFLFKVTFIILNYWEFLHYEVDAI